MGQLFVVGQVFVQGGGGDLGYFHALIAARGEQVPPELRSAARPTEGTDMTTSADHNARSTTAYDQGVLREIASRVLWL